MNYRKYETEYSTLNNCDVTYVCTTDLGADNMPVDVYYQSFPHEIYGNQYFGLFRHPIDNSMRIMNADSVLNKIFGMVENDLGEMEYSRSKNDEKQFSNGNLISGGRTHLKHKGEVSLYCIQNGRFILSGQTATIN